MVSLKNLCLLGLAQLTFTTASVTDDLDYDYELPDELQLVRRQLEDNATYDCHSDCGYAILAVYDCSDNGDETGPYDQDCLCASNSTFNSLMSECLECGWCLYTDYWPYLETAIASCSTIPITPTGSTCSPTASYSLIALETSSASSSGSSSNSTTGSSSSSSSSNSSSASTTGSGSSSSSGSSSTAAGSSTSAGMGNSLAISGLVGAAAMAILMI